MAAEDALHKDIQWVHRELQRTHEQSLEGPFLPERKHIRNLLEKASRGDVSLPSGEKLVSGQTSPVSAPPSVGGDDEVAAPEPIVEALVATALARGITQGIKEAQALRKPYLLDQFHDTLADRYYAVLKEQGNAQ